MSKTWVRVLSWLFILAMPLFLGFTTIRLIISEAYPRYAYSHPNFPPDPFGFTAEQRLDLALVAVGYLQRREPADEVIFLLEEQRLPGTNQPLYNEEEVSHMIDVKNVTDAIRRLSWVATAVVLGGLIILALRLETRPAAYRALMNGGFFTTGLLVFLAGFILLAWSIFFVQFHELLFPPGTWTFAYSDSLIRLFPEKFWFDLGVILSVLTLGEGIVAAAVGCLLLKRSRRA